MVDTYSKFVLLAPLAHKTSEAVALAVREHLISTFGVPLVLRVDNGTEFAGSLAEVCSVLRASRITTSPYHSMSNGQVE